MRQTAGWTGWRAWVTGALLGALAPSALASEVPGELLVQFTPDSTESSREQALLGVQARALQTVRPGLLRVVLTPGLSISAAARQLARQPGVAFAEPNAIYRPLAVLNDPYYLDGSLWGMEGDQDPEHFNPFGSQAARAWAQGHTGCGDVAVAVLDTGAQHQHPELRGNHWRNPGEIPGNGIDDDGNGFVDDVDGWDFAQDDASVYDDPVEDLHGTHVSGTIGARGGNGRGVAGVCWKVQLITVKFMGAGGGTTANAVRAIDYLIDLKTRHGLRLVAINASWGSAAESRALKQAIQRAGEADILLVAAAGGSGNDNDAHPTYPASYALPNVVAVTSIDAGGALGARANHGAQSVDLGAPGEGIWSTVPGGRYAQLSGTSMAAAHVSGGLALVAQRARGADAPALKQRLLDATTPTPALTGLTLTGGRLNLRDF